MHDFTPWSALAGGALIGLSASILLLVLGKVAGISGLIGGLLFPTRGDVSWRAAFITGLVIAGAAAWALSPASFGSSPRGIGFAIAAGLLVGAGTRLGNGCTSGHGVCGLSRLSVRSLAAVMTFMLTGGVTVAVVRLAGGWS